ncbi:hypothetical protein UlMin_045105 [Ulmus minor]
MLPASSLQSPGVVAVISHINQRPLLAPVAQLQFQCHCSLTGFREMSTEPITSKTKPIQLPTTETNNRNNSDEEEDKGISKIQVPRQRYIPVSKSELLDGILSNMWRAGDDEDHEEQEFLLLTACLDSILHAEHKSILEDMRSDYFRNGKFDDDDAMGLDSGINGIGRSIDEKEEFGYEAEEIESKNPIPFNYVLDLRNFLPSPPRNDKKRVSVATRFQRAFLQLLNNAEFEELSARDLVLTSSLNTDYLLTLPIYVDWKKASESYAIIFRRGYTTEKQKGLLIVEKLDYVQSKLLRGIFSIISKPAGKLGSWITEAFKDAFQTEEVRDWTKRLKLWLKGLRLFQHSFQQKDMSSDDVLGVDELSDKELPIWLAAQRAVSRYEGLLSPIGPRERLLRRLFTWSGLISPKPETTFEPDGESNASEPYTSPIFLSRISVSDIWRPATRKYCGNDIWKMLKNSTSILLSQSILQEPAFQELILLYTEEVDEKDTGQRVDVPSLQLKIYERIPIPELPVIFPHKKLSFRIIDTVRLDVATILGLLAYFINYKFVNFLTSPSALFLDVVAITALIIYISRVVLGYKQTRDRYQLLVNKALYEKTLASGFGSIHFLLDASEQQQYKEAILAYSVLLKMEKGKITCRRDVAEKCERFMYDAFRIKVQMPIDKAISTLLRLGLATETNIHGRTRLQAIPCPEAYESLKERWNSLLGCG